MKSAILAGFVIIPSASISMANYQTITQEQINQLGSVQGTKVTYSSMSQKGRSVMLGIDDCVTGTNPQTNVATSTATIGRCEEIYETQLVTIDPKGFFNEVTYIVHGTQRRLGVRKEFKSEVLSQDTSGLYDFINGQQRTSLDNTLSQLNSQLQCSSINARIDSSKNAYTSEEKQIIAECFGL